VPDDVIFSTACQQATVSASAQGEDELFLADLAALGKLTTADRQIALADIRNHALTAADAMGAAAAAIMERWPKLSGVDEVALQRAVADAWRIRAMADALEPRGGR
jgi:hypothetical protein